MLFNKNVIGHTQRILSFLTVTLKTKKWMKLILINYLTNKSKILSPQQCNQWKQTSNAILRYYVFYCL
jgi:hypothetical protein